MHKKNKIPEVFKNKSKTKITARDIAQKEKTTGSASIHKDRQWGNRQWKVKSINSGISCDQSLHVCVCVCVCVCARVCVCACVRACVCA